MEGGGGKNDSNDGIPVFCFFCFSRVMAFVQKAVARLHEPEKLETLLRELGRKHVGYGAKQKYVGVSEFIFVILIG